MLKRKITKQCSRTAKFSSKRVLKGTIEHITSGFDSDFLERLQASIFSFKLLICKSFYIQFMIKAAQQLLYSEKAFGNYEFPYQQNN